MQSKLPLIIAIIFGLLAFIGIGQYLNSRNKPVATTTVLVSLANKKRDSKLDRADIGPMKVPADMVRGMTGIYRPGDESVLAGRTLAQDIGANNVIMEGHLLRESDLQGGEAQFTSLLRQGQRAISIPVDKEGLVSAFVRPGDRVDILTNIDIPETVQDTIQIPNQMPQTITREVSRPTTVFLFQNVKVLAVGEEFLQPNLGQRDPARRSRATSSVTIAVTPEEAQILSYAMRYGNRTSPGGQSITFTLLLRRGDDPGTLSNVDFVTVEDLKTLGDLNSLQLQRNVRNSEETRGSTVINSGP